MSTEQTLYVIKTLLRHYGEHPEQDDALIAGALAVLEGARTEHEEIERSTDKKTTGAPKKKQTKTGSTKPKKTEPKRNPFDTGKMIACLQAGRSVAWVADEMGVSDQTIRNHMKKEGIVLKSEAKDE